MEQNTSPNKRLSEDNVVTVDTIVVAGECTGTVPQSAALPRPQLKACDAVPLYILRSLQALRRVLAEMGREQRCSALATLSPMARRQLLRAMEQGNLPVLTPRPAAALQVTTDVNVKLKAKQVALLPGKQQCCSDCVVASPHKELLKPSPPQAKMGVKATKPGFFQASVCFDRFLIRSPVTPSMEIAFKYRNFFDHVRITVQETREASFGLRSFGDRVRVGLESISVVTQGRGLELGKLTFAAYVSAHSWVGKVESPSTSSIDQALIWRDRLQEARQNGWATLRSTWIALLLEAPTVARRGSKMQQSGDAYHVAEGVVDRAWERCSPRRDRLLQRASKVATQHLVQESLRAQRKALRLERRFAKRARHLQFRFQRLAQQTERALARHEQIHTKTKRIACLKRTAVSFRSGDDGDTRKSRTEPHSATANLSV